MYDSIIHQFVYVNYENTLEKYRKLFFRLFCKPFEMKRRTRRKIGQRWSARRTRFGHSADTNNPKILRSPF